MIAAGIARGGGGGSAAGRSPSASIDMKCLAKPESRPTVGSIGSLLAMIRDYPWTGCGPGNFQGSYTRYKLPEASEVVADPHNFLMEIWATAGTPAALALLAILGCVAWQLLRTWHPAATGQRPKVTRARGRKTSSWSAACRVAARRRPVNTVP
jgi:hypothetical protein